MDMPIKCFNQIRLSLYHSRLDRTLSSCQEMFLTPTPSNMDYHDCISVVYTEGWQVGLVN